MLLCFKDLKYFCALCKCIVSKVVCIFGFVLNWTDEVSNEGEFMLVMSLIVNWYLEKGGYEIY